MVERDDALIYNTIIPRVKDFYESFMLPLLQEKLFPMI